MSYRHSGLSWAQYGRRGIEPVALGDTPNLDAFGRVRVADPASLFDVQLEYGIPSLILDTLTATTGASVTHNSSARMAVLTAGTSATGSAVLQSREYMRYQPGKSQFIAMTGVVGAAVSNTRKRFGYFDSGNGIFFEQSATGGLRFVKRRGSSDSVVAQSEWNLDPLDGTGQSETTLDITQAQILVIDFQALYVGRVRVGFDIDGSILYAHEFTFANESTTPYIQTANLPVRWEIANTTNSTGGTFNAICASVVSEGGFEEQRAIPHAVGTLSSNGAIACTTGGFRSVLSLRPTTTYNGYVNRAQITPTGFEVFSQTNPCQVRLIYGGTFTSNASWAGPPTTNSVTKYNLHTATGAVSGGTVLWEGFVPTASVGSPSRSDTHDQPFTSKLPLTLDISGANPIALTLAARGLGGTANVRAAMTWKELS